MSVSPKFRSRGNPRPLKLQLRPRPVKFQRLQTARLNNLGIPRIAVEFRVQGLGFTLQASRVPYGLEVLGFSGFGF